MIWSSFAHPIKDPFHSKSLATERYDSLLLKVEYYNFLKNCAF